MRPRARTQRPTLSPEDEAKLASSSAELADAIAETGRCTADLLQFTADVDSERISMDGIVLLPIEEEDSLVSHVEDALRGLAVG
jgi:hypothetical protein